MARAKKTPSTGDPNEPVDMRFTTPLGIVQVIDAIAHARRVDRGSIINDILLRHCRQVAHEATIVMRVTGGNPRVMDSNWQKSGIATESGEP